MKSLQILIIFINFLLIQGVRDPKKIEYLEKKIFAPTLDELRTGEFHKKRKEVFLLKNNF